MKSAGCTGTFMHKNEDSRHRHDSTYTVPYVPVAQRTCKEISGGVGEWVSGGVRRGGGAPQAETKKNAPQRQVRRLRGCGGLQKRVRDRLFGDSDTARPRDEEAFAYNLCASVPLCLCVSILH